MKCSNKHCKAPLPKWWPFSYCQLCGMFNMPLGSERVWLVSLRNVIDRDKYLYMAFHSRHNNA